MVNRLLRRDAVTPYNSGMTRVRLLVLVLGPLPIVAASLALSAWVRSAPSDPVAPNQVVVRGQLWAAGLDAPADAAEASGRLRRLCHETAEGLSRHLGKECSVLERPPFVLAGDMGRAKLEEWHERTIGPAARAMAHSYFQSPPDQPVTVLLFSGEPSYNHYADKLFGDHAVSIYGYYKPRLRTLVMNIGTGGGTLVHELTHALMDFDFPRVPDWINEGLASLHEQCRFHDDEQGPWIEGIENWRLAGLQKTIRGQRLRSLESLVKDNDFRGRLEGVNYAQARYFCLYLQRQGLLVKFYRGFREQRQRDPLGAESLMALFPDTSWPELDRHFQEWVLTLRS